MGSFREKGYDNIMANYESLVNHCSGFGAAYNPSNPSIQLPAMQSRLTAGLAVFQNLIAARNAYNHATNARLATFQMLPQLATRVINALVAVGAPTGTIDDAKAILRKIRGGRAGKKRITEAVPATSADETTAAEVHTVSVSRKSFESQVTHLQTLIELVSTTVLYNPNEPDLAIPGLNTYLSNLRAHNTSVNNALVAMENARVQRNEFMGRSANGIIALAKAVKGYVKSAFGARSPQFLQVSGINFS